MSPICPRCATPTPAAARFCPQCGLRLEMGATGLLGAGRLRHPNPTAPAAGWEPVENAADLYYRWYPVGGGRPLLGTEPLEVRVFNGGYSLANATLRVELLGETGARPQSGVLQRELADCPRGEERAFEIASWELNDRVQELRVTLVQAEFGPDRAD